MNPAKPKITKVQPGEDVEMYRLYILCSPSALQAARVKAVEKGDTLAAVIGAAVNRAFKPKS